MPKSHKKILPLLIISGIFAFLITSGLGCKGISADQQQLVKPLTLEYWTVADDVDALKTNIEKYKLDGRSYLTVNVRQLRASEFYQRLIEALAEDKGPDIISISNRMVRGYLSKIAPMPASVSDARLLTTKTALGGDETTVQVGTIPLVTPTQLEREYVKVVKEDAVIGDKVYGLPLSLDTLAVYYNKDLLDRAGVPEAPKNWDEFQAAVKKINKYDRVNDKITQSGVAFGAGKNVAAVDDILFVLFRQSGVPFSDNFGRLQFGSGRDRRADANSASFSVLDFYTDFANPTRDTYGWNKNMGNAMDAFVSGKVGFMVGYSYDYPTIKARAPQLNIGVLPLFQLNPDQPVNVANYYLQAVTAKSKHQNEAWGLIDYLAHSKATKDYLDASGRPTALRAYIEEQRADLKVAPFVEQVLMAENWYRGSNYSVAAKAVGDMVDDWLTIPAGIAKEDEARQGVLNNAVAKVGQTL
ncbi:MAG: hypothetical protein A3J93_02495 [Candidatus Magasanikbacteria bacterium RIFOXYC2_FULL_42_28]|uniref:Sugar ABC transporter substrate-binding protein n=1 Tax=Candidatus Magasanikbacteria bacterium RIFOXYC2_FULL_42_28 TaxID=1798704 RepID=A0A1F6NVR8_9BACT|nr:MAG: hypothetical protein A3J93_02495 [Candidatus Magasanikbacteria bacterium RIFOXYC2_FULL_42_28]